jgi:hypothetical protein
MGEREKEGWVRRLRGTTLRGAARGVGFSNPAAVRDEANEKQYRNYPLDKISALFSGLFPLGRWIG